MEELEILSIYIKGIISQYNINYSQSSTSLQDLLSTCINFFIDSLRKSHKSCADLSDSYRILDLNYKSAISALDSKDSEIQSLTSTLAKLESQMFQFQSVSKQEKEKILKEKDQIKRENLKLASLCNQYQHEIKKIELKYSKIQDQLRKYIEDKELNYKNSAEICKLFTNKPACSGKNRPNEDFLYFMKEGQMELNRNCTEIALKLNEAINKVFDCLKAGLQGLGFEVNWGILSGVYQEGFSTEVENRLRDLREVLKKLKKIENFDEIENIEALKNVIEGYKGIFESQIIELLKV